MIWRHAYRKIHICKNKASDLLKTNNNNNKNILHSFYLISKIHYYTAKWNLPLSGEQCKMLGTYFHILEGEGGG